MNTEKTEERVDGRKKVKENSKMEKKNYKNRKKKEMWNSLTYTYTH